MINKGPLKVKVGVYSALLTILALVTGGAVVVPAVYYHQIRELDDTLRNDAEELVRDLQNFRGAPVDPRRPLSAKFIPLSLRGRYLVVEGPEGQVLYQSPNLRGTLLEGDAEGGTTRKMFGRNCRIATHRVDPYLIRIGTRLGAIEGFRHDLLTGILISVPAVALVVFIGGVWLGRRAVAPVAAISAAAERISASNPDERLPMPPARDEIARLTAVLNDTFDRLQASYEAAIRFSADASHQLKTPVAVLRAGLDNLSATPGLDAAHLAEIEVLRHQTRRLTGLIQDLLLLAKADAGRLDLETGQLDLAPLAEGARDDLEALVAERGIRVQSELPATLPARADRRRMRLVFQNLAENAAKYTPDEGIVRIRGSREGDRVLVAVANTGPLIPPADRETIFERFRRGTGVGENVRGHGLGLNIARELVRAQGGELVYRESTEGWNEFAFHLPA